MLRQSKLHAYVCSVITAVLVFSLYVLPVITGSQLSLQLQVQFSAPAVTVECPCNISNVAFPASTYAADPLSTQSPASAYMLRASPTLTVPNTNASNFYHYIVYDSTSQFAIELRLNVPGSSASLGVPLLPYFQPSPPGDVFCLFLLCLLCEW